MTTPGSHCRRAEAAKAPCGATLAPAQGRPRQPKDGRASANPVPQQLTRAGPDRLRGSALTTDPVRRTEARGCPCRLPDQGAAHGCPGATCVRHQGHQPHPPHAQAPPAPTFLTAQAKVQPWPPSPASSSRKGRRQPGPPYTSAVNVMLSCVSGRCGFPNPSTQVSPIAAPLRASETSSNHHSPQGPAK